VACRSVATELITTMTNRATGMMERRKTPRKDWVIGKDEVGRAVLEWKVDYRHTKRRDSDPCARTYDFLQKLETPDLVLEQDSGWSSPTTNCNPYDRSAPVTRKCNPLTIRTTRE
jgi:hypothetical protein